MFLSSGLEVCLCVLACGVTLHAATDVTIEKMKVYSIEGPTLPPPVTSHKPPMRGTVREVKLSAKHHRQDQQGAGTEDSRARSPLVHRLLQEVYGATSDQPAQQPVFLQADVVNQLLGEHQTSTNLLLDDAPNAVIHKPIYLGSTRVAQPQLNNHEVYNDEQDGEESQYGYEYKVHDAEGNNFGHNEKREGARTWGSYYVHLPDGRLKTVNYWADHSGYHAEVEYEGTAQHPEPEEEVKFTGHN